MFLTRTAEVQRSCPVVHCIDSDSLGEDCAEKVAQQDRPQEMPPPKRSAPMRGAFLIGLVVCAGARSVTGLFMKGLDVEFQVVLERVNIMITKTTPRIATNTENIPTTQ